MTIDQNTLNVILAFSSVATAIGTIGACAIALIVSYKTNKKDVHVDIKPGLLRKDDRVIIINNASACVKINNYVDIGLFCTVCNRNMHKIGISSFDLSLPNKHYMLENSIGFDLEVGASKNDFWGLKTNKNDELINIISSRKIFFVKIYAVANLTTGEVKRAPLSFKSKLILRKMLPSM